MADEEQEIDAIVVESVEDLHLVNGRDYAIRVRLSDVANPVFITLSVDMARRASELLLLKGPPPVDEDLSLEFPDDLEGEFAVSDVEVGAPAPDISELPFQFTFRIGDKAVHLRISHQEVVRWHRRIGAQIREQVKKLH